LTFGYVLPLTLFVVCSTKISSHQVEVRARRTAVSFVGAIPSLAAIGWTISIVLLWLPDRRVWDYVQRSVQGLKNGYLLDKEMIYIFPDKDGRPRLSFLPHASAWYAYWLSNS